MFYVILHLKRYQESAAAELADVIRRGRRDEIGQLCSVISLAEIMRQHMKDWESAEAC